MNDLELSISVLVSQLLTIALSIAWLVHAVIVKINGVVYFVEPNLAILYLEIFMTTVIALCGIAFFILQIKKRFISEAK
jgi:Na+-transporting NADH:ubiquinone oxidoreductase subunit NqrE